MKTEDFNRMLRSARDLLAKYHEGVTFDETTISWAQELTAANPVDKRRPTPKTDVVLALFDLSEAARDGLTCAQIGAQLPEQSSRDMASLLYNLTHKKLLWLHRPKGSKCCSYYATERARDAAAKRHADAVALATMADQERREELRRAASEKRLAREAALEARAQRRTAREQRRAEAAAVPPKLKIPRLAKTKPPRKPRDAMTTARKAFNDANSKPKACLPPSAPKLSNPVRGRHSQGLARPMSAAEPIIPPGLQVQVCPGYRAPHERWADERPAGAGFAAEWARLRGAQA
jgi:hypothetical protein